MTKTNMELSYNVSGSGAAIAFMAGSCLSIGLNLLNIHNEITTRNKVFTKDHILMVSAISFLGGGLSTLGIYTLVPNQIRGWWSY